MARYKVILAYDGTGFHGFQLQPKNQAGQSVQSVIEATLRSLGWRGSRILAAGRTDAGVHASGQVIAFDLDWRHPVEALQAALNAALPPEVAVREASLAQPGFHPRYDARARTYRYRLYCQPARDPLRDRYAWRVWPATALAPLQSAADLLVGEHDFTAFGTPPRTNGSTIRCLTAADWQEVDDERVFSVTANAFLYRMVRRMVAFQVAIAQGRRSLDDLARALSGGPQPRIRELAPSQGLTLVEVCYPAEPGGDLRE